MDEKRYNRLLVACTLSPTALAECAIRMKPSHVYNLYVNPREIPSAMILCRRLGAFVEENPFAPYINLFADDKLKPDEWFIEGEAGEAWGSEGL